MMVFQGTFQTFPTHGTSWCCYTEVIDNGFHQPSFRPGRRRHRRRFEATHRVEKKNIPPIADVILYLMWCNVINQIIIMNSYNKHLGMVWIPFMVTLGMVHEVYALGFTRFTTCNWRTRVYQWEVPSARGIYHFFLLGTSVSNQESVLIRCWTYVVSGQEPDYKPVISGMSLVLSLSMYIWV